MLSIGIGPKIHPVILPIKDSSANTGVALLEDLSLTPFSKFQLFWLNSLSAILRPVVLNSEQSATTAAPVALVSSIWSEPMLILT